MKVVIINYQVVQAMGKNVLKYKNVKNTIFHIAVKLKEQMVFVIWKNQYVNHYHVVNIIKVFANRRIFVIIMVLNVNN